ncbi:hypothetical protein Dimus_022281, partial [Dionaea muscipula]
PMCTTMVTDMDKQVAGDGGSRAAAERKATTRTMSRAMRNDFNTAAQKKIASQHRIAIKAMQHCSSIAAVVEQWRSRSAARCKDARRQEADYGSDARE